MVARDGIEPPPPAFSGLRSPSNNYTKHSLTLDPRHRSLLPGQDKPYSLMLAAAGGSLSKSGGKCDLPISRCRYHVIHPPALPGCISDRCHPCQGVGSVHMRSRPDTHRYLRQFITSSIRPVCPAAFRTDATPAKESVPCTCGRDRTHIGTLGSSSTGRSASLLVRVRRGGTGGIAGRSSPASGTPLIDPISCAVRLRRRRSVRSPWPRPDPAPAPCRFASG